MAEQAAQIEELTAALQALKRENAMITGNPIPGPSQSPGGVRAATHAPSESGASSAGGHLRLPQSPMLSISSAPSPIPSTVPTHMTTPSGHLAPVSHRVHHSQQQQQQQQHHQFTSTPMLTADTVAVAASSALESLPVPHSPMPTTTSTAVALDKLDITDPSQTASSIMSAATAAAQARQHQPPAHLQSQFTSLVQPPSNSLPLLPPDFLNGEPQMNSLGSSIPTEGTSFEPMRVPAAVQEQAVRNMEAFLSNLQDSIGTFDGGETTTFTGVGPSFVIPTTDTGGMAPAVPSGPEWNTSTAGGQGVLPGPGLYNPDLTSLMDDGDEPDSGAGVGM